MKNIKNSLIALFGILAISSCTTDDVQDRPIIQGVDSPVLTAPDNSSTYTLLLENMTQQAERFVWSAANYNGDVVVSYTLEMDIEGGDFSTPQTLGGTIGALQLPVTVETLNDASLALGATAFNASNFDIRVVSSASGFDMMASNKVTITIIPYTSIDPVLYMVGAPQAYYGLNGWDNSTAVEMRYIGDGITKVFEAYIKVAAGEGFKFIGEQGTWDNGNFGTIGGAQDGVLENSGGSSDIKVAEIDGSGLYYVRVNIDNLTYKAVKMNWGIIGDSTPNGWNGETVMTYDFNSNSYSITTTLANGELKFRSSNTSQFIFTEDWKFNVGNSDPKVAYDINAPNFPITAGSFTLGLSVDFLGNATVTGL
ncbi:SusE domain-containing protein [uncultured Flavobacterium sp.]|uniref:SusE domain-containing protein n=1 Tax=uncultured Flavobacterium sp. TaxID=165435 RepID=UPI0030EF56AB